MHHHINHCWCSHNHINGEYYDAPNMVDLDKFEHDEEDWDKMVESRFIVSEKELEFQRNFVAKRMKEDHPELEYSEEMMRKYAARECPFLKPEVIEWLDTNIKPQRNGAPGWSMGDEQYRMNESYRLTLWFQRRNDAKKFIRTWSKYKKATSYFNYFDSPITNLVLDLETGKYYDRHSRQDDTDEELEIVIINGEQQ